VHRPARSYHHAHGEEDGRVSRESRAIRLLKRALKTHPGESPIESWDRSWRAAIPGYSTLDRGKRRDLRNNLKAAVRSRMNTAPEANLCEMLRLPRPPKAT